MSLWYDKKGKTYASKGSSSWVKHYAEHLFKTLTARLEGHLHGGEGKHRASDIIFDDSRTLAQTLDNKVDKVSGMGLSQQNFTFDEKKKLEGIAPGATAVGVSLTPVGSEAFNDSTNTTNVPYAHLEGRQNSAQLRTFLITNYTPNTVTLTSTAGIKPGMSWFLFPKKGSEEQRHGGTITSVQGNVVTIMGNTAQEKDSELDIVFTPSRTPSLYGTFFVNGGSIGTHIVSDLDGNFSLHLEGRQTSGTLDAHAEGYGTKATGLRSHAEGQKCEASADSSHAEGYGTRAEGIGSHAEGGSCRAAGSYSHAEGGNTVANGNCAHAEGNLSVADGVNSHAEGNQTVASGKNAHAEGTSAVASGESTHAEGGDTVASNNYAHAEGYGTKATGLRSHAEGQKCEASADSSHAEGYETRAEGIGSHTEGGETLASNSYAHAEGQKCEASADSSHAEGYGTRAEGIGSHAEGGNSHGIGNYSHAEGEDTAANGNCAHAEGNLSVADGANSHAEGNQTVASGKNAHAEGNSAVASGENAHAEGNTTVASGESAHAEGFYTKASAPHQHVEGRYNLEDTIGDYAHIVGNGSAILPSNAYTLDWLGNGRFAGKVYVENDKELATMDDISKMEGSVTKYLAGETDTVKISYGTATAIETFKTNADSPEGVRISVDEKDVTHKLTLVNAVEYMDISGYDINDQPLFLGTIKGTAHTIDFTQFSKKIAYYIVWLSNGNTLTVQKTMSGSELFAHVKKSSIQPKHLAEEYYTKEEVDSYLDGETDTVKISYGNETATETFNVNADSPEGIRVYVGEKDVTHKLTLVNAVEYMDISGCDMNGRPLFLGTIKGTAHTIDFTQFSEKIAYYEVYLPNENTLTVQKTMSNLKILAQVKEFSIQPKHLSEEYYTKVEVDSAINNAIGVVLGGES